MSCAAPEKPALPALVGDGTLGTGPAGPGRQPPRSLRPRRAQAEGGEAATRAPDARDPQAAPGASWAGRAQKLWPFSPGGLRGSPAFRAPARPDPRGCAPTRSLEPRGALRADPGGGAAPPSCAPRLSRRAPDAPPPLTSGCPCSAARTRSAPRWPRPRLDPRQDHQLPSPKVPPDLRPRSRCPENVRSRVGAGLGLGLAAWGFGRPAGAREGREPAAGHLARARGAARPLQSAPRPEADVYREN